MENEDNEHFFSETGRSSVLLSLKVTCFFEKSTITSANEIGKKIYCYHKYLFCLLRCYYLTFVKKERGIARLSFRYSCLVFIKSYIKKLIGANILSTICIDS